MKPIHAVPVVKPTVAWKVPPMGKETDISIPAWAMSALMTAVSRDLQSYGDLVGRYIVSLPHGQFEILDASDFYRKYHEIQIHGGAASVVGTRSSTWIPLHPYLQQLRHYLSHLGSCLEGPDGMGTVETAAFENICIQLDVILKRGEAPANHGIQPFVYLQDLPSNAEG